VPLISFSSVSVYTNHHGGKLHFRLRHYISPTLVYQWRKQLLGSAEAVYTTKREAREDRRIEKFSAEATRMKNVIAEITAENLDLKKTLSD
jgi:hypothetical protein